MKVFKIMSVIALATLLLFSLARLYGNINRFGTDSPQVDFSVYYTVGQSLNAGFPLYQNGIVAHPPIWDGAARYVNSRFAYSPLTAVPFALLAGTMTYGTAKFFWMYFSLACLVAALFITIRALTLKPRLWQYLALGVYVSSYFPLLIFLERGQIESLLLLIMIVAIAFALHRGRREIASGFLWAFATLIKIHIGVVVLFFMLRKQWNMLAGYLLGGITIIILTLAFLGPTVFVDYVTKELPRIARYGGDSSTPELKLPDSYFEKYYAEYGQGHTSGLIKGGQWFKGVHLSFAPNASLARFIVMRLQDINKNWQFGISLIPIVLTALFLPLAYFGLRKIREKNPALSPDKEFLYWYAVLMIIMLVGPVTWTMTAVWIIPLAALAVARHPWSDDNMELVPWLLLVVALVLAFVPDCMYLGWRNFDAPSWGCKMLDSSKYIFAELLIVVSLWLHIKKPPAPAAEDTPQTADSVIVN